MKALHRRRCWGETGTLYQHDPRHVDVLVESLGLENGNTVQTPIIDDVRDENPVWLDSEQISKYRSHVARRLFLSRDRADITFVVNELCLRMSDPFTTQHFQIEATRFGKDRETMDPSVLIRGHELRSDSFLGFRLGWRQKRRKRRWTTPSESVHKKTEDPRQKQCPKQRCVRHWENQK